LKKYQNYHTPNLVICSQKGLLCSKFRKETEMAHFVTNKNWWQANAQGELV
jgi:hypothetical protein